MPNFKLTIEYDGRNFSGWQIQKKGERTVQGKISLALERITRKPVTLIGAGRTDSGVHALGQIAHAKLDSHLSADTLLKALNANLPDDIAILKVQKVPVSFHAQYSAKAKVYRYTILNRKARAAQKRGFYTHIPQDLDLPLMKSESKVLRGCHNFSSFTASNPYLKKHGIKKNTIRNIKKISFFCSKGFILIDIEADGFLYKMVRNIIGTLIEIGLGRIKKGELKKILCVKVRRNAGPTAPAQGLCLLKVKY
jgi:tRNA pseudouridine38-40 synthase